MYSGKTSELIRLAERYRIADKRVLVVKYGGDDRYTQDVHTPSVATHNGRCIEAVAAFQLKEIVDKGLLDNHDVICVDEIQFYPDSHLLCEWADSGKTVVASGLTGNYLREQFQGMPHLMSNADCIEHLTSVCMNCKKDGAAFSALLEPCSEVNKKAATKLIGGQETYLALCRKCYCEQNRIHN